MIERRTQWRQDIEGIEPDRFVFLDESCAKTNMTRGYGWGQGGARVVDTTPGGHWQTTTMLASIRVDGVVGDACLAFPGATDGAMFRFYVEAMLAPTLRCGDIVVMDNLAAHKVKGVREAIEACGAEVWYLPPYSPDLNPIEPMWSKVKALIRKAKARTVEPLYDAIGHALRAVTAEELANYYADCGYATRL